ncbi:DUF1631 family protein [Ramlibacter terrae]|uniref:DUF1631 family protein n=1 Tax=Ramlibacter terrae TaxID=2732511 RepID=A0ABX6P046_9BURK|nr:DUF1631 family protein [Ramlibacter terrae]
MARHLDAALATPIAIELETLYRRALELLENADLQAASYRVLPVASVPAPVAPAQPKNGEGGTAASANAEGGGGQPMGAGGGRGGAGGGRGGNPPVPCWAAPRGPTSRTTNSATSCSSISCSPAHSPPAGAWPRPTTRRSTSNSPPSPRAPKTARPTIRPPPCSTASCRPLPGRTVRSARPAPSTRPRGAAGARRASARWSARSSRRKPARSASARPGRVVRKLVDQVARDPRLLAPVREAIVALEPALLRLPPVAPRFFSQHDHAGRRLVERVAERSFKYNDEFAGDFHGFHSGVRSAFQSLNEAAVEDESPFAEALRGLEAQWEEQDALEAPGRQVAVDAMYFAEARDAEAAQIAGR